MEVGLVGWRLDLLDGGWTGWMEAIVGCIYFIFLFRGFHQRSI